jgi:biopolymer transport protein ExbB
MDQPTLMDMFRASGAIGLMITLLSVVGVGFVVEHLITIRRRRLIPSDALQVLEPRLAQGRWEEAIAYCTAPENACLVTDVVLAGLERVRTSEFGFAEYKSAMEEAGEEYTSRLYRKIEVLNVIGVIAPMLGLLGTVQGMILAFNTIAVKGGMARPDELAGAISLALVTTFEGLVVAIPAMIASSYFRNKIDSLVAEAGKRLERLTMPLGRRRV